MVEVRVKVRVRVRVRVRVKGKGKGKDGDQDHTAKTTHYQDHMTKTIRPSPRSDQDQNRISSK